ncbi:MAG: hypothetical protein F4X48_00360 [Acidimicrobiia bacterium]|nr:hypothetical protein [Acidimicrobiia bacterium]MYC57032.1 hypothetical protein [Acidimicrobiia bacterium]MYI31101.1 hypothetical protein [Acidimicrobiia bacterium]
MLLMVLAAAWAAFLIPPLVRRLRSGQFGFLRRYSSWGVTSTIRSASSIRSLSPRMAERGAVIAPVVALRPHIGSTNQRYAAQKAVPPQLAMYRSSMNARHRRRRVLVSLIVAALASFVFAIYLGGLALLVHLVIDAMLLVYAMALVQHQRRSEERFKPFSTEPARPGTDSMGAASVAQR